MTKASDLDYSKQNSTIHWFLPTLQINPYPANVEFRV